MIYPPRANFFDASALVKVFAREPDGARVRKYWEGESPTKYTSPFCLYEALSILKGLWKNRKPPRYTLTGEQYHKAAWKLVTWYAATTRYSKDLDLHDPVVLRDALALSQRHSLDLSDAFQILCVKEGLYSRLVEDSQTVLVTADGELAQAATVEGIKSWNCLAGEPP
jgi:predicted nucleic acid-binding protein